MAWFSSPWFVRSDALVQGHSTLYHVLLDFLRIRHPYGSLPNIFTFLWCLWKARNDFLFDRAKSLPHQVQIAALALTSNVYDNALLLKQAPTPTQFSSNQIPLPGRTLRSDLLVDGAKIYSVAAFRSYKIPGML